MCSRGQIPLGCSKRQEQEHVACMAEKEHGIRGFSTSTSAFSCWYHSINAVSIKPSTTHTIQS